MAAAAHHLLVHDVPALEREVELSTNSYRASRIERQLEVTYDRFTQAFERLLGRMDAAQLHALPTMSPKSVRDLLASFVGPLDFSLFQVLDHGAIVTALTARRVRATTYVFGNALIAVTMTEHDPRAGLYVPLRLLVMEIAEGRVLVTYDLPSAQLTQFPSDAIAVVAHELDGKVARLVEETERAARIGGEDHEQARR
jgi:uncharacterized protein (DUF302 family)